MTRIFFFILFIFISCGDYYGRPVPIGDEFEDHWKKINFEGVIYDIEDSKANENEFFIIDENSIYIVDSTIRKLFSFSYPYPELTTLSSSFSNPLRLLIGTNSSKIYYCNMEGVLREFELHSLGNIKFLSFSPLDTTTIFATDGNLLLKVFLTELQIDTLYYSNSGIISLLVSSSAEIFLTSTNQVCSSIDQGLSWDTLYIASGENINGFALDKKGIIYLSIGNKILKSEDRINWTEIYTDSIGNFSIAGIDNGLLLLRTNGDVVSAFKIDETGKSYDISLGIVHTFVYIADSRSMLAVNGNRYLISFCDADEKDSALLIFLDTILPP
uniref:WD40 repeat domain-containing protein n=1 Tax=candidate division WOR-3 bacterium TaxID=2052148 RepID=A0A7C6AGI6_UNCW3